MAGARIGSDLPLAGRVRERAELERAVTDARLGSSRVLVISGEPGIGKTSLLRLRRRARPLGRHGAAHRARHRVGGGGAVRRRCSSCCARRSSELDRIPAAQAEALRSALDLGPTVERDRFVIGAATLNLLSARSERAPLLVLVDDAHWLDDSSLSAILFAARRLLVDPVAVVFAVRSGEASALEAAGLPELPLAGLDAQAAAELVARHAGAQPSEVVEHLARVTGGNPLALVELAPAATQLEPGPAGTPLELETSVEAAYGRRIAGLPEPSVRALALAAADDSRDLAAVGSAAAELGLALVGPRARRAGRAGVDRLRRG